MIRAAAIGGECMTDALAGFFASTVDIIRPTTTQNEYGEPVSTWAVVSELTELPCLIAGGDVSVRMKRQEMRTNQEVYEVEYRRVLLNRVYDVQHEDRARFDGIDWAIVSIVPDATGTFLELLCESIRPGVV